MDKPIPAVEAIKLGDLDEKTAWMMFDPSPEAEREFIESLLTIPNEQQKIVDMKLYPQQKRMLFERTGRDITIKGRQTRASSLILARNLRPMVTKFGVKQLVMTQDEQTTTHFRLRIRHHLEDLARQGWEYEIDLDNDKELVIAGLENHYVFGSGQQRVVGRAYTGHIVHLSELSHWPNQEMGRKLIGDLTPAVPGYPHGQFDIESTPNGADDVFYDYVMDSRPKVQDSRWTTRFYPWWTEPRYKVGAFGVSTGCDILIPEAEYIRELENFRPDQWEERLIGEFGLKVDQILWRRRQEREMAKTGISFIQEYPETLDTCFVARGDSYFASPDGEDHLKWYRGEVTNPVMLKDSLPYRGGTISFFGSNLRIWEPPQPGEAYCGYLDCAGGGLDERSDFTALGVLNARTLRHVATLHVKASPSEVAPMAAAIMTYYNTGLLGGERDAFGKTALEVLRKLGYPNLWYHVIPGRRQDGKIEPWAHPTQTRDMILQNFRTLVFAHSFLTRDEQVTLEMGAFTWQKVSGREGLKVAGKGQKDDLVIACAGACYIAPLAQARYNKKKEENERSVLVVGASGLVIGRESLDETNSPWFR